MNREKRNRILKIAGTSLLIFLCLVAWYGHSVGQFRYQIHNQTFYFQDLPEDFDGYRIVQFTDMHIGTLLDGQEIHAKQIVQLINDQKADAILFTGDLVNRRSSELDKFVPTLRKLHAPDGVYAVLGNHDYGFYCKALPDQKAKDADTQRLVDEVNKMGWRMLVNEHVRIVREKEISPTDTTDTLAPTKIQSSLVIAGVENSGFAKKRFPKRADLAKTLKGVKRKDFIVMMSHDPTHWRKEILPRTSVQLTLSGHTHAGQFRIFGWSPVSFVYPEWSGVYMEGNRVLSVSDGCGSLIPLRVGAWPEINVITLRKIK